MSVGNKSNAAAPLVLSQSQLIACKLYCDVFRLKYINYAQSVSTEQTAESTCNASNFKRQLQSLQGLRELRGNLAEITWRN
jgi:hypothetical protein